MHRRQMGQALPLGLALILFGILGGFVLYNTGQTATDKARLVNTADAAAYSGVLWQARALNFNAYTNRAMVANQVSMAQAVSLASWTAYGRIAAENVATVLAPIPVVGQIAEGVKEAAAAIQEIIEPIAEAMVGVIDGVNAGISIAQEGMYASTFAATPDIVRTVVEKTDPRFVIDTAYTVVGLLGNLGDWRDFTAGVSDPESDEMSARAEFVMASRDDFSRDRNWSFFDDWLYLGPFLKHGLFKEGQTVLNREDGEWEWKAKDTQSAHLKWRIPFRGWKGVEVPVGYGEAFANTEGSDRTIEHGCRSNGRGCPDWGRYNRTSEDLADRNIPSLQGFDSRVDLDGYGGLHDFRQLSADTIAENFPTMRLKVEVAMPLGDVAATDHLVAGAPFDADLVARGDMLSSISIAEVIFKHPAVDREVVNGGKLEFANAYSPWWDVRLGAIPAAERLAAFAMRPGGGGSVVPGGGGLANYDTGITTHDAGALTAYVDGGHGSSVESAVASSFASLVDVDSIKDDIKGELEDELEDAIERILAGMMESAVGQSIANGTEDTLAVVEQQLEAAGIDPAEITANSEAALAEYEALQAEFERIEAEVGTRLEEIFDPTKARWEQREIDLREDLAVVRTQLADTVLAGRHDALQMQADALVREVGDLAQKFEDDLVAQLIQIVDDATDQWDMPLAFARETISTILLELAQEGVLDVSNLFGDEEATDE